MTITNPKREALKAALMAAVPFCTDCGRQLFVRGGVLSPSLVVDHLFCQQCVDQVRQRKYAVQVEIIAAIKKRRRTNAGDSAVVMEPSPAVTGIPVTV